MKDKAWKGAWVFGAIGLLYMYWGAGTSGIETTVLYATWLPVLVAVFFSYLEDLSVLYNVVAFAIGFVLGGASRLVLDYLGHPWAVRLIAVAYTILFWVRVVKYLRPEKIEPKPKIPANPTTKTQRGSGRRTRTMPGPAAPRM